MSQRRLNILLLCDLTCPAATIRDHVSSIKQFSAHNIYVLQILGNLPGSLKLDKFDAILIHYTLIISMDSYLSATARERLSRYAGIKAVFIQDEYRFIDRTVAALQEIKADVLFTVVPEDTVEEIYPSQKLPDLHKVTILTGYVPQELTKLSVPAYEDRSLDVAYRGRVLPYWLGKFSQEKWVIGEKFKASAVLWDLTYDISSQENDRLYQNQWINFLTSAKAVLGVESGASVCDFDAEIERKVRAYLAEHSEASFEEVQQQFFAEQDGKVVIKTISPRCFEAAALRTLLILYEGSYSGILEPWRHYVPLKKDHSNMSEVVAVLKDPKQAKNIIDNAYREIALNEAYAFKTMVKQVDGIVLEKVSQRKFSSRFPYNKIVFKIYSSRVIFRRFFERAKHAAGPTLRFLSRMKKKYWSSGRGERKVGPI